MAEAMLFFLVDEMDIGRGLEIVADEFFAAGDDDDDFRRTGGARFFDEEVKGGAVADREHFFGHDLSRGEEAGS